MANTNRPTTRSLRSNTTIRGAFRSTIVQQNSKQNLRTSGQYGLGLSGYPPFSAGLQIATSFSKDPDIERALLRVPRFRTNSVTGVLTARVKPNRVHDCHHDRAVRDLYRMGSTGFLVAAEMDDLKVQAGTSFDGFAAPIEGELQVHGRGPAGNIVLLQTEVGSTVLYIPHTNNSGCDTRSIPIAGGQLFDSRVFNGRNPHDIYNISVSNLRTKAAGSIGAMGFVPT
ncbi:predicted protein [Histoplasma capsulatum G186AR]|uniref:Uncharacterized protein n=1 Tax=Ajellomyces capsulatus (strain G186AR / H82 / ATCC MYA-2454 / RMSCC 2432) TaxID=447093 RepID=C0P0A4_AJECG|nr:uncharacterized protein HCBG_08823 [Histoplasma capsulatum G186AR]EEH02920.1 predicted protein [Histoplasma capsulatum G186AR]